MKSKAGIIVLIILLTIIVIILTAILVLALQGRFTFMKFSGFSSSSNNIIYEETYTVEALENIEIDAEASDIIFKENEDGKVKVVIYGDNEDDAEVNMSSGKLAIRYPMKTKHIFGFNIRSNDIIVYVPKDYEKTINITNNYGNCKITDLEKAAINISAACGDVKIGKINEATVKADYGNVDIDTIFNKCELELDCGNVTIEKLEIKENSSINNDYGNIKIKEKNDIFVEADVDLGNKKIDSNNRQAPVVLKIKADCGNVKVGD